MKTQMTVKEHKVKCDCGAYMIHAPEMESKYSALARFYCPRYCNTRQIPYGDFKEAGR